MPRLEIKPTHKAVQAYYASLQKFERLGVKHEGAVRSAFQALLEHCASQVGHVFIPEYQLARKGAVPLEPDGAVVDSLSQVLRYGLWEAKDTNDDLEREIKAKIKTGYPRDNILFQEPRRAILYQNGERLYEADLTKPDDLVHVLDLFFAWQPPVFDQWEKAVAEFKVRVPEFGKNFAKLIQRERQINPKYQTAFADFLRLCRVSLNPNLSEAAVEEMLIQHLLTERIFRKIFDIGDFMQRNVIAVEIEKVIDALTSKSFSRDHFTKPLQHFYIAIEQAAETITDFHEKQRFLNTVYEEFFQGFCVRDADILGIVYTPLPLVNFMIASVQRVLVEHFKSSLSDDNVQILDPFTGTGNFIVHLMQRITPSALPHKYRNELWCNEIMLLPYYVASMNIEHAYYEVVGQWESFPGVCLVDTFETAEKQQHEFDIFNEANTERVKRQRKAPIKVIIANPPYNAGQINENDNNKNRKYPEMDRRVSLTYGADSQATLRRKLSDPYVKAIRFATDRIEESGIVCYVNNNSFVTDYSFDAMRKQLAKDFDLIYVLDLGGNIRKGQSGVGNVFGITVGVSINLFIKLPSKAKDATPDVGKIFYFQLPDDLHRKEKFAFLEAKNDVSGIKWRKLKPDERNNWFPCSTDAEFEKFLPIGSKDAKNGTSVPTIFKTYSLGVSTNRDSVVYDFDKEKLAKRTRHFCVDYNSELRRWKESDEPKDIDTFVNYGKVKWSRDLKRKFRQGQRADFGEGKIQDSLYRPFTRKHLFFHRMLVDTPGSFDEFLPTEKAEKENLLLIVPGIGSRTPYGVLAGNNLVSLDFAFEKVTCFPLFTYSKDGTHRQDNLTPKARTLFQIFYDDDGITRADVFHYVYAILNHPGYRNRFAENLKRDLPRIPLVAADGSLHAPPEPGKRDNRMPSNKDAAVFHAFVDAGRKLVDLHIDYESVTRFPLDEVENRSVPLNWRVETMKLTKDKSAIVYNEFLTLSGIPPEVFDYKLGNRSALEWIIDQYRVTKDEQDNIASDPNRADDEKYIVNLIGKVITVSLDTMRIVKSLPMIKS
jgi:predicted helicase